MSETQGRVVGMRRDFQVAILLALAALPAGVALMAAPEYFGVLKEYPGTFFWGGLLLTAALIGAAIVIAIRGEAGEPIAGHKRRMIALAGMIGCGAGFAGLYFWPTPHSGSVTGHHDASPPDITVHNLFLDDFERGSYKVIQGFSTDLYRDGKNLGNFPFEIGMYGDFQAKSLFMSLYVPGSDTAFDLISWFSTGHKDYLYDVRKNVHIWTASPGTQNQLLSDDLIFTRKIYVYYENILSTGQLHTLADFYRRQDLEVEFRGFNYMDYRKKVGPPLSAAFGKMKNSVINPNPRPLPAFTPDPTSQIQPTLLTLFMTEMKPEHGAVGLAGRKITLHFDPNSATQVINLCSAIYYDRSTHIITVAVYVPHTYYTANIVVYASTQIKEWIKEANNLISSKEEIEKYRFEGGVYVYSEDEISDEVAKHAITKAMVENGLITEYRSVSHLMMMRYEVETHQRPMPPLYELTSDIPTLIPGQPNISQPDWTAHLPTALPPAPTPPK
jgi:hypothetical protein